MKSKLGDTAWIAVIACSFGCGSEAQSTMTANASAAPLGSAEAGTGRAGGSDDRSVIYDAGPASDPEVAYTVTLKMNPFTVAPGQEIYMCQSYANPFGGAQADIKKYELDMAEGSHHMFLFYLDHAPDGPVVPCSQGGLSFSPFTFAAQSRHFRQSFPEGVGANGPSPSHGCTSRRSSCRRERPSPGPART